MSAAARALMAQEDQRRRRLIIQLTPDLGSSGRQHNLTQGQGHGHGQETSGTGELECSDAATEPLPLSASQLQALAALRRRHPTAVMLAENRICRGSSQPPPAPYPASRSRSSPITSFNPASRRCCQRLPWVLVHPRPPPPPPAEEASRQGNAGGRGASGEGLLMGQAGPTGMSPTCGAGGLQLPPHGPASAEEHNRPWRTALGPLPSEDAAASGRAGGDGATLSWPAPARPPSPPPYCGGYDDGGEGIAAFAFWGAQDPSLPVWPSAAGPVPQIPSADDRRGAAAPPPAPPPSCVPPTFAAIARQLAALDLVLNPPPPLIGRSGREPPLPLRRAPETGLRSLPEPDRRYLYCAVRSYVRRVLLEHQRTVESRRPDRIITFVKPWLAHWTKRVAQAAVEADRSSQCIADFFSEEPQAASVAQLLMSRSAPVREVATFLERWIGRRTGGGGDGGEQAFGFGERWRRLMAAADSGDEAVERVAALALHGFLLHLAEYDGDADMDLDPLECAAVSYSHQFSYRFIGVEASVRHLFSAFRLGFLPSIAWYLEGSGEGVEDDGGGGGGGGYEPLPLLASGAPRFTAANIMTATFRATYEPAAIAAWAALARALTHGSDLDPHFSELANTEAFLVSRRWREGGDEEDQEADKEEKEEEQRWLLERQHQLEVLIQANNLAGPTAAAVVDAAGAGRAVPPSTPLLALELLDVIIQVAALPRTSFPAGGAGGAAADEIPCTASVDLERPEQAMVLFMWEQRRNAQTGQTLFQPAVLMTPLTTAAAADGGGAAAAADGGGDGELQWGLGLELLACRGAAPPGRGDPGYKWGWIRERIPMVTSSSNLAAQVKVVLDVLLKKRLLIMWMQCKGLEGLRRMLQALSQARREMLEAGRDLCFAYITVIDWGGKETEQKRHGSGEDDDDVHDRQRDPAQRNAAKGRTELPAGAAAPPLPPPPPRTQTYMESAVAALTARVESYETQSEPGADGCLAPEQLRALSQSFMQARQEVERLLAVLTRGGGPECLALREGMVLEFMLMECVPGRPWDPVRPEVPERVRQQQEKRQSVQRRDKALYGSTGT